jgi:hypothetical protein
MHPCQAYDGTGDLAGHGWRGEVNSPIINQSELPPEAVVAGTGIGVPVPEQMVVVPACFPGGHRRGGRGNWRDHHWRRRVPEGEEAGHPGWGESGGAHRGARAMYLHWDMLDGNLIKYSIQPLASCIHPPAPADCGGRAP